MKELKELNSYISDAMLELTEYNISSILFEGTQRTELKLNILGQEGT